MCRPMMPNEARRRQPLFLGVARGSGPPAARRRGSGGQSTSRRVMPQPPTSIPPTPTDAIAATLDAWSAVHAEAAAVAGVIGLPCATSADCDTGDAAFPGSCQTPYYGQAQCSVPSAPAEPLFTCADYSCPVGFQCEQELGASVACVQRHQTCTAPAGAASTGKHHGEGGG